MAIYDFSKDDTYSEHFVKMFMQKIDPELISDEEEKVFVGVLNMIASKIVWSSNLKHIHEHPILKDYPIAEIIK